MTKQELRKQYLDKRQSLSEVDYKLQCEAICSTFFSDVDLSAIKTIHIFLPITKKREPNTFLIIERLKKEYPTIRIAVPKVNTVANTLETFLLTSIEELEVTTWGIPEPAPVIPVASSEIDAVIIPLLVFDERGHRIGYGKGFYDKFLSTCKNSCLKIGLSFFPPVKRIEEIEIHDQPLDAVLTPGKIYTF